VVGPSVIDGIILSRLLQSLQSTVQSTLSPAAVDFLWLLASLGQDLDVILPDLEESTIHRQSIRLPETMLPRANPAMNAVNTVLMAKVVDPNTNTSIRVQTTS